MPGAEVPTREILGVPVAMVDYERAMDVMDAMVSHREPGYVCAVPVHGVTVAQTDSETRRALRGATMNVPDGMPLVWAANALGGSLEDRVYGPDLMLRYSGRCAERGHRVWLYGGGDQAVLDALTANLRAHWPDLDVVGGYSPPFRPLTAAEETALAGEINRTMPDVLWVGTGVSRQEKWMARMRDRLEVPVMCGVGAAFDFHAGLKPQAPAWMQRRGLEWVYRAACEPRRLIPRYLKSNPLFVAGFARQLARERRDRLRPGGLRSRGGSPARKPSPQDPPAKAHPQAPVSSLHPPDHPPSSCDSCG